MTQTENTQKSRANGFVSIKFCLPRIVLCPRTEPHADHDETSYNTHAFITQLAQFVEVKSAFLAPAGGLLGGDVDGGILISGPMGRGDDQAPNLIVQHLNSHHGPLAIETGDSLQDSATRHHFLCRIYAFAELRDLRQNPSRAALCDFQRRHKHVLMTYDQHKMRALGAIAAEADSDDAQTAYRSYAKTFREALSQLPTHASWANSAQHMYGHFKEKIPDAEKTEFLSRLAAYRAHELSLEPLLATLRTWCARYEYQYFADQTLLAPYPQELAKDTEVI